MDEATSRQLEALRAQMYQLSARRQPVRDGFIAPQAGPVISAPYWLCETLETQGVTAGSDWDLVFNRQDYARVVFGKPTGLGELGAVQVSDGNNRATRCRLLFHSPQPFEFRVLFTADTYGRLQYKLNNSPYTELSAESLTTLTARAGVNLFQVSIGTQAGYASRVEALCRILYRDAGVQWLDPFTLDLEGYPPPGGGSAANPDVSTSEA